jgi:hypothetical protein
LEIENMDRSEEIGRIAGNLAVTLNWATVKNPDCHQIVTKSGTKRAETKQIQTKEILRYLAADKGI